MSICCFFAVKTCIKFNYFVFSIKLFYSQIGDLVS